MRRPQQQRTSCVLYGIKYINKYLTNSVRATIMSPLVVVVQYGDSCLNSFGSSHTAMLKTVMNTTSLARTAQWASETNGTQEYNCKISMDSCRTYCLALNGGNASTVRARTFHRCIVSRGDTVHAFPTLLVWDSRTSQVSPFWPSPSEPLHLPFRQSFPRLFCFTSCVYHHISRSILRFSSHRLL